MSALALTPVPPTSPAHPRPHEGLSYLCKLIKVDKALVGKNLIDGDGLDPPVACERHREAWGAGRARRGRASRSGDRRPRSQLSQRLLDSPGQGWAASVGA